jgi:ATP adenylyltransferase
MDKIYAPWRQSYVTNIHEKESRTSDKKTCVFCAALAENADEKHFILKRGVSVFTMLNLYPYAGGHVMVLPNEHHGELFELGVAVRAEVIEEVNFAIEAIKKAISPHGFNMGLNIGKAGGGGIPSHFHMHVLPRWNGDTNFMPLLSNTRPVSCSMLEIYQTLLPFFV